VFDGVCISARVVRTGVFVAAVPSEKPWLADRPAG
jgi:hypothetical protein